jgi:putative transposase
MRRARWIAPWRDSEEKPAIYHCISRVVERRFVFGDTEREQFRIFMRMYENFSGCRVLSYCIMSNHIHILLEVPPMPKEGLSDEELMRRLSAIYSEGVVDDVKKELLAAREKGMTEYVATIHARYTYRMHDLSQFMKTLMQRMTQWFNREQQRKGTLWEERFKSVIVESGDAARMMAAYIDLNPVRAGMVADPAEYRWSSYGEAVGGRVKDYGPTRSGAKGNGKKAREGLVRAIMGHKGAGFESEKWKEAARVYRKMMGLALERKSGRVKGYGPTRLDAKVKRHEAVVKKSMKKADSEDLVAAKHAPAAVGSENDVNNTVLPEMKMAEMLGYRIRYFTSGAVVGSKMFVNDAFSQARERFSSKRKDGARAMKGDAKAARGVLWSIRDLKV